MSPSEKRYRNDILTIKFLGNYSILNELTLYLVIGIDITLKVERFRLVRYVPSTFLFLRLTLRFLP